MATVELEFFWTKDNFCSPLTSDAICQPPASLTATEQPQGSWHWRIRCASPRYMVLVFGPALWRHISACMRRAQMLGIKMRGLLEEFKSWWHIMFRQHWRQKVAEAIDWYRVRNHFSVGGPRPSLICNMINEVNNCNQE